MTQHLNYCRQMVKELAQTEVASKRAIQLAASAEKFMLPDGGILLEDPSLRAIDESERLNLPYPVIALEFQDGAGREGERNADVLLIQESADRISCFPCNRIGGKWIAWNSHFWMPRLGYMDRAQSGRLGFPALIAFDVTEGGEEQIDPLDSFYWARVLLSFVNALSCANVSIERSPALKQPKASKGALAFDDYHVLKIELPERAAGSGAAGGAGRSPREHLRRGHIRRLSDGRKLWVNATVVNPGVGGKVQKSYSMARTSR